MRDVVTLRCGWLVALFGAGVAVLLGPVENRTVVAQPADPLLEAVRAAWAKRQEATHAVRLEWIQKDTIPKGTMSLIVPQSVKSGEILPPTDTTREGKGLLLLDGDKSRIDIENQIWDVPTKSFQTWDVTSVFQEGKSTTLTRFGNQSYPGGSIKTGEANPFRVISLWPALAAFRGTDPKTIPQTDIGSFSLARRTTLDGVPMIELIRERQEVLGEAKVWVDSTQDYAARRFEQYSRAGALQHRITITNRKDPSGVWVPASWTTVNYRGLKLTGVIETRIIKLTIKQATTPDDFRLEFPVGTKVSDSSGRETRDYIVREGGRVREIPRQELGQKYSDLVRTEPGELVPSPKPSFWLRNIWWGLGALVVGAFLLLVWRVYRVRGRADSSGNSPTTMPEGPR